MKSNRRSVLIGLGALTVGGGAVFGTGAFSSVEAERSVSVSTTGDGDALLAFDVETTFNGVDDGGEDVVEFNFGDGDNGGNDLNQDAETTFDDVLEVTNNGNDGVVLSIDESEEPVPDALTFETASAGDLADGVDIPDGESENITVIIDLDSHDAPENTDLTFNADTDGFSST